jgi:CMP-N,N'-diacetyllegionaminic acid synthase
MNILFTICGRAGSKGIKNKNIKEFLGSPLPFYTVSAIDLFTKQISGIQYDIVLNTDSKDLIKLFQDYLNIKIDIIERSSSLGLDHTPKISVIQNSLDEMEKRKVVNYDMVVDLDITSPLRTVEDINNLINKKVESSADVVFSVTGSRRNPYFNMVKKTENGYERVINTAFNSRQEAPEVFDMNASLYAFSPQFLESKKGIFESRCEAINMKDTAVLDLDHEFDLELMEVIAKYLYKKNPEYGNIKEHIKEIMKK